MIETLRCPACHAAYGLRPERVHAGIRRAQCARCPEIFGIEDAVARLLAVSLGPPETSAALEHEAPLTVPEASTPALERPAGTPDLTVFADEEPTLAMPVEVPAVPELDLATFAQDLPDLPPLSEGEPTLAMPVAEEPLVELDAEAITPEDLRLPALTTPVSPLDFLEPLEAEAPAPQDASSLTLTDLEGSDDEILDKTLLMEIIPQAPQAAADQEGFSSAKDAISRILGGLDAPAGNVHPHAGRISRSQGVDMEATLNALDHSLGVPASQPPASPLPPAASPGTATTVRISIEDIRAAIDSVPMASETPEAAVPTTVPAPFIPPPPPPARPAPKMETPAPSQDPNLLKVQVGNEVYTNVSVEQLTQWIEQGRILESHQVARQFSEHWIDAVKVPALRPVFDRVRRARIDAGAPLSVLDTPQKKSLFGGLFGR